MVYLYDALMDMRQILCLCKGHELKHSLDSDHLIGPQDMGDLIETKVWIL